MLRSCPPLTAVRSSELPQPGQQHNTAPHPVASPITELSVTEVIIWRTDLASQVSTALHCILWFRLDTRERRVAGVLYCSRAGWDGSPAGVERSQPLPGPASPARHSFCLLAYQIRKNADDLVKDLKLRVCHVSPAGRGGHARWQLPAAPGVARQAGSTSRQTGEQTCQTSLKVTVAATDSRIYNTSDVRANTDSEPVINKAKNFIWIPNLKHLIRHACTCL